MIDTFYMLLGLLAACGLALMAMSVKLWRMNPSVIYKIASAVVCVIGAHFVWPLLDFWWMLEGP